jgi:hypothetical protein
MILSNQLQYVKIPLISIHLISQAGKGMIKYNFIHTGVKLPDNLHDVTWNKAYLCDKLGVVL